MLIHDYAVSLMATSFADIKQVARISKGQSGIAFPWTALYPGYGRLLTQYAVGFVARSMTRAVLLDCGAKSRRGYARQK
jgi:hypothetical protein